jgi:hypothetical protein
MPLSLRTNVLLGHEERLAYRTMLGISQRGYCRFQTARAQDAFDRTEDFTE